MAEAEKAFDQIYNLDYDKAEAGLELLRREYPNHPAPPMYLAMTLWLQELLRRQNLDLDLFLSPAYFTEKTEDQMPPEKRELFTRYLEESRALSEKILERDPQNDDALYFLGAAYGVLGSFAITVDHSVKSAFSYGNEAYKHERELMERDPEYYDAYMAAGMYEYIVGSLPWYFKWFAALVGYHGSKEQGFEYLRQAAERGTYVKNDAKVLLMVLSVNEERYEQALSIAEWLHRAYPRNYIFPINVAQIAEKLGRNGLAAEQYQQIMKAIQNGLPNYDSIPLDTFRYVVGEKFFALKRFDLARTEFQKSIESSATPAREKTLSELRLGQILDLEGKREEAIGHYKAVLESADYEDSHSRAGKFLKKPYRGSEG